MNFKEFIASRREVADLEEVTGAEFYAQDGLTPTQQAGWVYSEGFYIEKHVDGDAYLMIFREDWIAPLDELELRLYAFAADEYSDEQPKWEPLTRQDYLDHTLVRMKREILHDMDAGRVPKSVRSFSQLHNHVDANEYGGFCEDEMSAQLKTFFGGETEEGTMPEALVDFVNECQTWVNNWLRSKGPAKTRSLAQGEKS